MTRRALVVRLDSDGDVLLAGPAVRAVATTAEVTLLCGPAGAKAADSVTHPGRPRGQGRLSRSRILVTTASNRSRDRAAPSRRTSSTS